MSTVTLSNPHCAITSAENPEGIASQALTTALPEAHTFLDFVCHVVSFHFSIHAVIASQRVGAKRRPMTGSAKQSIAARTNRIASSLRSSNDGKLLDRPLYTDLAHADFASGIHYRRPGIVRQGHAIFGAISAHFPLGIAGDQHGVNAGDRLGRPDKVDIARDLAIEEIAGIDRLGI